MTYKKSIIISLAVPLSLMIIFEIVVRILGSDLRLTNAVIQSKDSKVKCLIMGDSHTAQGFRSNMEGCVNLSLGGISIPMIADAVYSIERHNDLKSVILPLEPHNFAQDRIRNYTPLYKNISSNKLYFISTIPFIKNEVVNHLNVILGLKQNVIKDLSKTSQQKRESQLERRLKKHLKIDKISGSNYSNIFYDLVKYLIDRNISVYIVRTPVIDDYEDKMMDHIGQTDWNDFTKRFSKLGAVFIDYKTLGFDNTNYTLFSDHDHLNQNGSIIYSQLIQNHLLID